jgi:signal transduction histidine kinase
VGLTPRLLLLTVLFVLAAELIIMAPSLAAFHEGRLLDRVRTAELASLVVDAAPDGGVTDAMAAQLLNGAGVLSVAVQTGQDRRLLLEAPRSRRAPDTVDLRRPNPAGWLTRPFAILASPGDRMVRVVAEPTFRNADQVEVIVPAAALKRELGGYLLGLFGVTAFVTAFAGALLYLALNIFLVRPIQKITVAMERFRADPEDPKAHITPSGRLDEIGRAEAELDRMQADLRAALTSRARLAALGEAVAKINHDLRNMLSSAQIASERLALSGDPKVTQALPRLERALDRAIRLASDVLAYGRSEEAAPQVLDLPLRAAVEAAAEDAGLTAKGVRLKTDIPADARVAADPDQLHRLLLNLLRNAREAIEGAPEPREGRVKVSARHEGAATVLIVADNGPGVPDRAQARLFEPFAGSGRAGGTGLGLAISRELALAHGGELRLAASGPGGTAFEIVLPDRAGLRTLSANDTDIDAAPPVRTPAPRPRAEDRRRPRASRRAP